MAVQLGVYSFVDVVVAISGPGGTLDIASGGVAEEGVHIVMDANKDVLTIGANGDGMHSLKAGNSGTVTITLLKTANGNAQLSQIFRHQKSSSAYWGGNILNLTNPVTGDVITCIGGAFEKHPDLHYAGEGGMHAWAFKFTSIDIILGNNFQNTGL